MNSRRVVIAGGGAAGFFAAIACGEMARGPEILLFEKTAQFLSKVRISGGGRCNVTHACFDSHFFATHFPRGERALIAPFRQFQARDTVAWFESRGVRLKTEPDGRMFPVSDSSQTIIDCLMREAVRAGVRCVKQCSLDSAVRRKEGGFSISAGSTKADCDAILLATGGCRTASAGELAVSLGHTLEPPVPSLFTFHVQASWLHQLSGISVEPAEVSVPGTGLRESGALLITHWGLSGPVILRLSAWGARVLHRLNYQFDVVIDWIPQSSNEAVGRWMEQQRAAGGAGRVVNHPPGGLPARLWRELVSVSGTSLETRWPNLSGALRHRLIEQLKRTKLEVTGKSLNKEEFVTCGGVRLSEVNFKTMESRICPGLYFAGELLDVDGITGGFNFQAAWTTGWIAGRSMAGRVSTELENKGKGKGR